MSDAQAAEAVSPYTSHGPAARPAASVPRYAWHLAFLLAEQFGLEAARPYAADRCVEMAAEGDEEDRRVWAHTLAALAELDRTMRALDESLH